MRDDYYPVEWIPTTAEVYRAIYTRHGEDFSVFSSHSCEEGCFWHDRPNVLTTWGFKEANAPIIKSVGKGPIEERTFEYWIAMAVREEEE